MKLFALFACATALVGCAPITPYRYTGITPAAHPIAWDGYPSHAGEAHVEATFEHTEVERNDFPQVHDTALNVAATAVEMRASITPVRGLDIGIHAAYTDGDWTQPTATGTMPLDTHATLFGIGPEIRGSFFTDHTHHFAIGFAASAMVYQVPWTAYQLDGPGCSNTTGANDGCYAATNRGTDTDWVLQGGIYPSYSFGPDGKYGTVFALMGIHSSFKNDGFATSQSNGSTIEQDGFVPFVGGGYGIHTQYFHASVTSYLPFSIDSTTWGPGVMATIGIDLPLWHPTR